MVALLHSKWVSGGIDSVAGVTGVHHKFAVLVLSFQFWVNVFNHSGTLIPNACSVVGVLLRRSISIFAFGLHISLFYEMDVQGPAVHLALDRAGAILAPSNRRLMDCILPVLASLFIKIFVKSPWRMDISRKLCLLIFAAMGRVS
ncbi:hypothetical protein NPIL_696261 [Nephila pilipes]|uniref:Uncharacterized protein n=1 Tax=Nephila pilipes TaxID=299642 RepID=A0A8X6MJ05_NEPPI|nr:hypothetical protein NPIL_696261 [Nephila pilipes]